LKILAKKVCSCGGAKEFGRKSERDRWRVLALRKLLRRVAMAQCNADLSAQELGVRPAHTVDRFRAVELDGKDRGVDTDERTADTVVFLPAVVDGERNGLTLEAKDTRLDLGEQNTGFSHGESIAVGERF